MIILKKQTQRTPYCVKAKDNDRKKFWVYQPWALRAFAAKKVFLIIID
jgi:hypothetical protein